MSDSLKEMPPILSQMLKNEERSLGERSFRSEFECLFKVEWLAEIEKRWGPFIPHTISDRWGVRLSDISDGRFKIAQVRLG
jgi:hypothetical protein